MGLKRKSVYPAFWAWETQEPLSFFQVDTKDIRDKGSLGTKLVTHLSRHHLPRYQWTACDARTRLRFIAYSHNLDSTCGLAFLLLVLLWLRRFSIEGAVIFQTDWGMEFGGDNPKRVEEWTSRFLAPLGGALRRYPKGRKGYNGRVERSHRTDAPYLLLAARWVYVYNVLWPPPITPLLGGLGWKGNLLWLL